MIFSWFLIELDLYAHVILLHLFALLVLIFSYHFMLVKHDWVFCCWFSYKPTLSHHIHYFVSQKWKLFHENIYNNQVQWNNLNENACIHTRFPSRSNSFPSDSMTNCCKYLLNSNKLSLYGSTTMSCKQPAISKNEIKTGVTPKGKEKKRKV